MGEGTNGGGVIDGEIQMAAGWPSTSMYECLVRGANDRLAELRQ